MLSFWSLLNRRRLGKPQVWSRHIRSTAIQHSERFSYCLEDACRTYSQFLMPPCC
jgi:hypothetical protein